MSIRKPNYTQVPNALISLMPELKESELKVILAITRKTIGWQKETDPISITQLIEMTGMGRSTIAGVLKSETFKQLVEVDKSGRTNVYSLKISDSSEFELVQNLNQKSSEFELVDSSESEPTKETIKETKQKKYINAQFEEFWDLYDKKKGKKKALKEWEKIDSSEIPEILENVPIFKTHYSNKEYLPYPRKYLYNQYWKDEDFQKPKQSNKNGYHKGTLRPTRGDRQVEQLKTFLSAN